MELDEVLSSPGFWILAGGAIVATVMGYNMSKSWGVATFPIWQLILIIGVEIVAAAFFASRE